MEIWIGPAMVRKRVEKENSMRDAKTEERRKARGSKTSITIPARIAGGLVWMRNIGWIYATHKADG